MMTVAHRLIVIGASAGGIEALRNLVGGLPGTLPAAVCVVVHLSPESPGVLPQILDRVSQLPVREARNGERLEGGRIYVAPPDRHLLVEPGLMRVAKGPREHGFRPAIDPLFRAAAQVFGPAAIGVVLTGNLDDGTAGLWTIKKLGGTAIVQDPEEALFPSMPLHAARHVDVDYKVALSRIPSLLVELTAEAPLKQRPAAVPPRHIEVEVNIAKEQNPRDAGFEEIGKPSPYACPECHGVLLEIDEEGRIRFRCHTGHAYSVESLLAMMYEGIEHTTSAAVRSLEEASLLMNRIGTELKRHDQIAESARMIDASDRAKRRADAIVQLMREHMPESMLKD
jgi:two-component system, chemotaxis family, protein-glutamate methylesterase/glutaminase